MNKVIKVCVLGLGLALVGCSGYEEARDPVALLEHVKEVYPQGKIYQESKYVYVIIQPNGDVFRTKSMNNFNAGISKINKLKLVSGGL